MVCATPSFIEKDSIFWYICRITMWSIIYTRLYWKGFGLLIHLPYYLANYVIYHIHRIILKRIRSFDTFAVLLGKLCDLSYTQDYIEKDSVFWYICHITWQTMWSIIYTGGREERTKEKTFLNMIKTLYSFLCIFFHPTWNYRNFHQNKWWIPLQWYMEENGTGKPQRHLK